jgi:transcription elongation factor Elf1
VDFGPAEALTADGLANLGEEAGSSGLSSLVGGGAKKLLGMGASHLMGGALKAGENAIGMGGQQAGGMAPSPVTPAPNIMQFGSVQDIPAFLAALETSDSVKSVDEHHDDPEDQDQQEFNDGDKSPSNLENPNNEDSGKSGEDAARSDSPEMTGFAEDSPGIERMMMVLPLLLHYFNSDESGQSDPVIKGIHEALEAENPGYLNQKHPDGEKAVQMLIEQGSPKHHAGVNAMPSGSLPSVPTPGGDLPANNPTQTAGGTCPLCGGVLAADGSCPQCGFKQHPQGGPSQVAAPGMGGTSGPGIAQPFVGKVANNVGPNTPEQKAAVIELLQQQGREGEIPYVETEPWRFAQEMAQLQGNPNTAPLVDPSQQQQTPPPAMMGAPGGMPVQDPSQPAGGMAQPMQPMARTADANNAIPRCPRCNSATTTVEGEGDNAGDGSTAFAHCHSCGKNFDIPVRESRVILTEMVNPALEDASQLHDVHNNQSIQDPSRTWTDANGNELVQGQTYDLYTQGIPTPDVVKIVSPPKPDQLDLKLVGEFSNVQPDAVDDQRPDFHITPQQMQEGRYTFEPSDSDQQGSTQPAGAQGGMPGMEQIPQSPPTTDEVSSQYPNGGASISAAVMADDDEDMDDPDVCHKCGNDRIYHMASSPTRTMHECDRCGSAWETEISDYGERTAASDLSWIYNEGPSNDDFFSEMERAQKAYGGNSRNISSIAGSDRRLQEIHERLEANKMTRSAGRHFTPMEQKGLVNESGRARNADKLDLSGTHYEAASVSQAMGYDPRDPKNRANGMNAPDEHIIFGL